MPIFANILASLGFIVAIGGLSETVFAQPQPAQPFQQIEIVRLDPRFDELVPPNVTVDRIVSGRRWVEGPLWNRRKVIFFSRYTEQFRS